jgi:hypothetical protein
MLDMMKAAKKRLKRLSVVPARQAAEKLELLKAVEHA